MTRTRAQTLDEVPEWMRDQLLAAVLGSVDEAIVGKTLDGMVTSWNPAAERMYGYSAEEMIGHDTAVLCPPDRPDEIRQILAAVARGEPVRDRETVRRRKGGRSFPATVTAVPLSDGHGQTVGAAAIVRDLTEVKQRAADLDLLQRADEMRLANRNLEKFTRSVSHDLRAPLRAISGFSTVLLEDHGDDLGEDGRQCAERIVAATGQMSALIDDLLQLSSVARAEMTLQPVDLGAESARIAEDLQRAEPGRKVRFVIERPAPVSADRSLMRTVLQNLLGNAWKFTARTDEAVIEFGTTDDGPTLRYYVRDNGAGFDPIYMDKLFQPFQRLHTAAEFPGTGIGLASVAQIVERHGGYVWAEGAVGKGATFSFTLDPTETT